MLYQVNKLVKKFGNISVLKNINLEIEENEKIVIIGPSGSGKSTLLRCLNMLEKPTSGRIYYHGKVLNDKLYKSIQGKIGMVFQNYQLFDNLTVIDNLTLAPVLNKLMSKDEAINKARKYLRQIHLEDKETSYPSDLSGGQKQRVAIIRSLMMNPEVILFDEPTSALDKDSINDVYNIIKSLSVEGLGILIVSHDENFVKKVADRIIKIEN